LSGTPPPLNEAIVVDTSPEPSSTGPLASPDVHLFHFPWQDDFSQARNFGLRNATEKWALVLDCDELIDPEDFQELKEIVSQTTTSCLALPQRNYLPQRRGSGWETTGSEHTPYSLGAPGFQTAWSIRLFPAQIGLEYRGAVHETLDESVQEKGLTTLRVETSVHHQGHMLDYPRAEGRTAFYGNLLVKKVRQEPSNPMARYELAVHLTAVGKSTLAEKWLKRTLKEFPFWPGSYRIRLLQGEIQQQRGEYSSAAEIYSQALLDRPDWPACWQGVISARIALEDWKGAVQHLQEARNLFPLNTVWDQFEAQVSTGAGR